MSGCGESLSFEQLCHVLSIDEDIGDYAIVHVSAARDQLNRSSAKQLCESLRRRPSAWFAEFWSIDASESNTFLSDPNRVPVNDGDVVGVVQWRKMPQSIAKSGGRRSRFLTRNKVIASFGNAVGSAIRGASWPPGLDGWQAV